MRVFFPAWLAPVQAIVMNITDSQADYVQKVVKQLSDAGLRVKADLRNEKVGFKIREHTLRLCLICSFVVIKKSLKAKWRFVPVKVQI